MIENPLIFASLLELRSVQSCRFLLHATFAVIGPIQPQADMPSSIMTRAQKHFARFPPLAAPSMLTSCPFSSAQSTRNPYCFPCIIRHGAGRGTDAPGDALALASALFGALQHALCLGRHVTSHTFADQPAMRIQCLPSRSVLLRRELGAGTSHFLSPAKRCPMPRSAFRCFCFVTIHG